MIGAVAIVAGVLAAAPCLVRLWLGPTVHDRAAAAHVIAVIAAIAVAACAVTTADSTLALVALGILLGEAVVVTAVLKVARRRSFQPALAALARADETTP